MTVREALDEKRRERAGNLAGLVLCKSELFYLPQTDPSPRGTVYPVNRRTAEAEARFFKVPFNVE